LVLVPGILEHGPQEPALTGLLRAVADLTREHDPRVVGDPIRPGDVIVAAASMSRHSILPIPRKHRAADDLNDLRTDAVAERLQRVPPSATSQPAGNPISASTQAGFNRARRLPLVLRLAGSRRESPCTVGQSFAIRSSDGFPLVAYSSRPS